MLVVIINHYTQHSFNYAAQHLYVEEHPTIQTP